MTTLRDLQEGLKSCMTWLAEEAASQKPRYSL